MVVDHGDPNVGSRCVSGGLHFHLRGAFFIYFALFFSALFCGKTLAQPVSREYQVKAAFLYNFVQFVEWPPNTFENAESPFRIGILGEDPFGPALDQIVRGESIHGHRIEIVRSRHVQELEHCQMIFISRSDRGRLAEILQRLGGRQILTASEVPGFAARGGIINFYLEGNKVRFEINPSAARREGLKISSQLLNLGRIVEPEVSKGGE